MTVPVIAIDGPAASGKGTIAQRAADALGWHYLDSGALYRLAALAASLTNKAVSASSFKRKTALTRLLDSRSTCETYISGMASIAS